MLCKKYIKVSSVTSEYELSFVLGILFINNIENVRYKREEGTTYTIYVTPGTGRSYEDLLDDLFLCGFTKAKIKEDKIR